MYSNVFEGAAFPQLRPAPPPPPGAISIDLPECPHFRRLWVLWDDLEESDRQALAELASEKTDEPDFAEVAAGKGVRP